MQPSNLSEYARGSIAAEIYRALDRALDAMECAVRDRVVAEFRTSGGVDGAEAVQAWAQIWAVRELRRRLLRPSGLPYSGGRGESSS